MNLPLRAAALGLLTALAATAACSNDGDAGAGGSGATVASGGTAGSGGGDCVPATCDELGVACGNHDDGCGSTLSCSCSDPLDVCNAASQCEAPQMQSSISQYGITWSFDGDYATGQYVNGDWWVLGPVTITEVSPGPTGTRNGSMVDPVGAQAYDGRGGSYDGSKGVSFPLTLSPDSSLVSSISHPEQSDCTQGSSPGWYTYDGVCQRGPIATQAVLTVVASPPSTQAFRPPYAGSDKPGHSAAAIDWSLLPDLPPPASAPDGAAMLRHVERPWIDHLGSWTMQHGCATLNMYCYGREIGDVVSNLSTFVLLDTPERDTAAIRLIQIGIDNYGVLQAGGGWGGDGGHFNGRKWPIVFAGGLLNEPSMAAPGIDIGNEDRMTYLGTNAKALWGRDCNACYFSNGCSYGGSCSNGAKDCRDPAGMVDGCSDYRNCCTSRTWVGEALAARLLALDDDWGHAPFFDYVDRWMEGDVPGGGGTSSAFVGEMWTLYR